ncbi:NBPF family member NBPF1 isoform 10 [Homo sapiens]|uniref:NBPF family member NBPF1 isoform 10 n=1 Tax=Homo sapiens TaxID=9606 RepID=UPI002005AB30|nr:neuroblastoma breakpoint family member 1 isoform 10 [Homo sapiens]
MVVSAGPWSSEKAETNILEINEKLRPQLAEKKQQFRNLKEKCFVTQLAGFLANRQKKYKNDEDEDEDVQVEEAEKVLESSAPREVQKAEESKVPEDSLEECAITCSNSHGPCDSNQPHKNINITFEEDKVNSALVVDRESSHDECQDAVNILPVPGPTSSATNVSMVVSAGPLFSEKAEMNILEINEKLHPQLAEKNQQFRNLKEKCFVTQLACFLANQQNKYKYEECKDLIKSMLRKERQFKEEKLAEQLKQAEELRQYKVLVHSQERELTHLREKLREGRDASRSLNQHLQALLTPDKPDKSQGQDLQEQLAEGCRLAQQLFQKLSPENDEDEDEDVQVEEAEKVLESSAPREVQKAEESKVPEDSLEECAITCSNSHSPCDSNQPHKNINITFEEDKVNSTLVVDRESSHDECQDAVNILPVPGPTSSATNVSMVVSAGPLSSEKAEMNILEINEKLHPQLAEKKQQFRNLKEKCFVTQLACFLANQQNKYKYEECKDLIKSMLRNERQFKEEKLAEQLKQAEELRQYKVLVHSQERELTQLREKLREGRDASRSLNQHLQALLTPDEPDKSQGQDLQEQLAEGCRLAQHLVQKLSPENDNDDDEDVQVEVAEKVQESSAPREMPKAEEKEVPEDSLEECAITCSNSHGPYDSNQPHRKTKITFEEDKVDSTLIGSSSHVEWEDAVHIIPENESDDEEEEEKGPVSPRNLQESEEEEVPQESWDEGYSTLSIPPEMLASYQSYSGTFHSLEEQQVCMAVDIGGHRWDQVKKEDQEATGPRLSRELLDEKGPEVLQDSLDRCYSTPSGYLELTDSCQPYRSAFYILEQQRVGWALDMDEIEKYQEVEEDQDPSCPRLSRELLDEKEPEVLQDSLDRCYSTPSGYLELPDLGQPYRSAVYSLEEQYLGLALDVDRIKKDQEEEEDQGPPCPRLSRELLEAVEPEVLQDSLDRCYSTPSSCLEQPDSCLPYGSSFYALEEKHVGFSLDVGEIEKKGKGKKRRGRRSTKKRRRRGRKEGEEDQNPPCPRLSGVLMEVEEPEVLQDSLDRCYSTPSMFFELPDSFQHYRSVFYSFEEQHISFALDVDNRFLTLMGTSLHLVFQMGVIFPQ